MAGTKIGCDIWMVQENRNWKFGTEDESTGGVFRPESEYGRDAGDGDPGGNR